MAAAAPKGGGALGKKVGGLPVKIWVALGAGLLVLYYLHARSKNQKTTSAGTSATPTPATDTTQQTPDTTGGVNNLDILSELQTLETEMLVLAASLPTYSYSPATVPAVRSTNTGGGNTSPAPVANSPTKPTTSTTPSSSSSASLPVAWTATPVTPLQPGGGGKLVEP